MTELELSLPETASRLGVSWNQAWRLVLTGVLTGTKVAGHWRVDEASVVSYELGRSEETQTDRRISPNPKSP